MPKKHSSFQEVSLFRKRNLPYFLLSIMFVLCTLAYWTNLLDASNIIRFILVSCSLLFLFFFIALKRKKMNIPINIVSVSFTLFLLLQLVSILWAPNKAEAIFDASRWLLFAISSLLLYNCMRSHPAHTICLMARISLAVFCISLAVALIQIFSVGNIFSNQTRYAITSLFTHKGTFSMLLMFLIPFPLMSIKILHKGKIVYTIMVVLVLILILYLKARAVWLAGIAMLGTFGILVLLRRLPVSSKFLSRIIFAFTIVTATLTIVGCRYFVGLTLPMPNEQSGVTSTATINERQALWRMTFRMVDAHPIKGCGVGNWKVCYGEASTYDVFSIDVLDYSFARPHNDYLRILSETGYFALFLLFIAMAALFSQLVVAIKDNGSLSFSSLIELSFLVGFSFFAFVDFPFDRIELLLWSSVLVGCALATNKTNKNITLKPVALCGMIVLISLLCMIGISRMNSEILAAEISEDLHNQRWKKVEYKSREAQTAFYNITNLGIPLAYYEGMAREYQHKDAVECFLKSLKDSPYYKQALIDLGRILYVTNHDVEKAVDLMKEAIRISPSYSYAYFNLSKILLRENRLEEAKSTIMALDLETKKQQINHLVWHYYGEQMGNHYKWQIIPSEESAKQQILDAINHREKALLPSDEER